ncbi:MAG: glycosyltransferase family 9 protein [Candidatus Woesearchaeota archaeon]
MKQLKMKLPMQKLIDSYLGGLINYGIITFKFLNPFKGKINQKQKTIIVYKLDAIGDSILCLPMIKHLKEKTNARIIVACSESNEEMFKHHKFIDKIITFISSHFDIADIMIQLYKLRSEKADLAIDGAQSSNISAIFSWYTAKKAIGFKKTKGKSRNKVYSEAIELDTNKHMVLDYFDLLKPLNIEPPKNIELIRLYSSGNTNFDLKDKIVVHPCSVFSYKTWPQERWRKVINYLTKDEDVVVIGSKEESKLVDELLLNLDLNRITNIAGKTNILDLISIINRSKMFIGIDGGPTHISAAQGIPTISLMGNETSIRYKPFNKNSIALYKPSPCSPCVAAYADKQLTCEYPICLENISAEDVIKAIEKLKVPPIKLK